MFIGGNFCRVIHAARPILPACAPAQPTEIIGTSDLARPLQ